MVNTMKKYSDSTQSEIEQIKKNLKDREHVTISSSSNQKIKLMRLGNRVYEVVYNYGEQSFENCMVDMYLSK
jgi:hypothetical protein